MSDTSKLNAQQWIEANTAVSEPYTKVRGGLSTVVRSHGGYFTRLTHNRGENIMAIQESDMISLVQHVLDTAVPTKYGAMFAAMDSTLFSAVDQEEIHMPQRRGSEFSDRKLAAMNAAIEEAADDEMSGT